MELLKQFEETAAQSMMNTLRNWREEELSSPMMSRNPFGSPRTQGQSQQSARMVEIPLRDIHGADEIHSADDADV